MKALIAMSGGVDSAVAACLILKTDENIHFNRFSTPYRRCIFAMIR